MYFTGGLVLTLRLAFADLPAISVVGQLPHDFLISIGVGEVIVPALAFGALHAILANTLLLTPRDERPLGWKEGRLYGVERKRFVLFTAVAPVVLLFPGAEIALWRSGAHTIACVLGGIVVLSLLSAVNATRRGCLKRHRGVSSRDERIYRSDHRRPLTGSQWCAVLSGLVLYTAVGVAVWLSRSNAIFLWLALGWAACAGVTAGYLQARGDIAERKNAHPVVTQGLLSLAFALLTIPGLVAFAGAWRLEHATVCTSTATLRSTAYSSFGVLVGETDNRVYVGRLGRITSIPESEVARVVIGSRRVPCAIPSKTQ